MTKIQKSLNSFLDENGILRINNWIKHAEVKYDIKFPIILPSGKNERIVGLLIKYIDEMVGHVSYETLVNNLKQKFWILKMTQSVKLEIQNCQLCKIHKNKVFQPKISPLPECHLDDMLYCSHA